MLSAKEIQAIAEAVAVKIGGDPTPAPMVIHVVEAARRTGFGSTRAFLRWAKRIGLRHLRGAPGKFEVASLNGAIQRAGRIR